MRQIEPSQAALFFAGREETPVLSFLSGRMGRAWMDDEARCAQIVTGDLCLFAGDADAPGARALAAHVPADHPAPSLLMIPHDAGWDALIGGVNGDLAQRITRYRLRADALSAERAKALCAPPPGYTLRPIDEALYTEALGAEWSRDFVSLFRDAMDYRLHGMGFAALWEGECVSGASSYLSYDGGIEIQVQTRGDHQRRGLAQACSAALIALCLERGVTAHWDAANETSRRLALRLGYGDGGAYEAWEVARS